MTSMQAMYLNPKEVTQSAPKEVVTTWLDVNNVSSGIALRPENNYFRTLFADITHRCNMECRNCYIPNREIPDMDPEWLYGILRRLPRRTRIRLTGGEPTLLTNLPLIIREVRKAGHLPVLMTNGLRMSQPGYIKKLKQAGLRTIHLSMNGGLEDDLYLALDDLACSRKKIAALINALDNRMYVTVGMIMSRGVNDHHLGEFFRFLQEHGVPELHVRSIGLFGRHMKASPYSLDELTSLVADAAGIAVSDINISSDGPSHSSFRIGSMLIQATQWPELGSVERGRITLVGMIEPCFEHLVANAGGY